MAKNIWIRSKGNQNIEVMSYGQSRKSAVFNDHSNDNCY